MKKKLQYALADVAERVCDAYPHDGGNLLFQAEQIANEIGSGDEFVELERYQRALSYITH